MSSLRAFVLLALLSFGGIAHGAAFVFEKGDALYRPKNTVWGLNFFFGHAAIYLNSQSTYGNGLTKDMFAANQLPNISGSDGLHSAIQAPGYFRGGVQAVPFSCPSGSQTNCFLGNQQDYSGPDIQ